MDKSYSKTLWIMLFSNEYNYVMWVVWSILFCDTQEITEIPDDFLNQSSVLKHLAKEVAQSPTPRGPTPPASPRAPAPPRDDSRKAKSKCSKAKLSKEKLNLSRSQPDLTRLVQNLIITLLLFGRDLGNNTQLRNINNHVLNLFQLPLQFWRSASCIFLFYVKVIFVIVYLMRVRKITWIAHSTKLGESALYS